MTFVVIIFIIIFLFMAWTVHVAGKVKDCNKAQLGYDCKGNCGEHDD